MNPPDPISNNILEKMMQSFSDKENHALYMILLFIGGIVLVSCFLSLILRRYKKQRKIAENIFLGGLGIAVVLFILWFLLLLAFMLINVSGPGNTFWVIALLLLTVFLFWFMPFKIILIIENRKASSKASVWAQANIWIWLALWIFLFAVIMRIASHIISSI